MSDIIRPGAAVLFMKVGTHAQEDLESIIARKQKEIADAGYAMWGYGGATCHPRTMVQPFAEEQEEKGQPIVLVMQQMNSQHFAEQLRARRYSEDGVTWRNVPAGINVLGSRYALVLKDLRREEHFLNLDKTKVAIGPSRGRVGSLYVSGRADKACLEVLDGPLPTNRPAVKDTEISLVAELRQPYAVFLRDD